MSYDALRVGRHSLQHQVYCITTVTHDRLPLSTDINAACLLVRELRRVHEEGEVISLAWVIMPDHLRWLIQLNDRCSLSRIVKTVKARSALDRKSLPQINGRRNKDHLIALFAPGSGLHT